MCWVQIYQVPICEGLGPIPILGWHELAHDEFNMFLRSVLNDLYVFPCVDSNDRAGGGSELDTQAV